MALTPMRHIRLRSTVRAAGLLAVITLGVMVGFRPTYAQTPVHGGLRSAIQIYESGDFPRALELMEAIQPSSLSYRDQAIRDLFRGFIFLAYGDETQAERAMESAVSMDATVRPDPALHSPSRLEFYERVRSGWVARREVDQKDSATFSTARVAPRLITRSYWTASADLGVGFGPEQFALIPAGSFRIVSTNGSSEERPVHMVNITSSFYLQRTEVTQGQWQEVMGTNPSHFSSCGRCPVEQVNWNDMQEFLRALNAVDPGKNYRLPTEAEWEYAARAGTTGDYGGTGVLDQMGWYSGNSGSRTRPVAQKQPNHWGLFDMHGNVWEWVQDWYSGTYYQYCVDNGIVNDPPGPASGSYRVLRGGSWGGSAYSARSAYRVFNSPDFRDYSLGFRLARTR